MTARRCEVCGGKAAGALPVVELRMTLCGGCDARLVAHLAGGGTADTWPDLEAARAAAVARAGVAARDAYRTREANRPGAPVDAATRDLAAWGVAVIRERRRGVL